MSLRSVAWATALVILAVRCAFGTFEVPCTIQQPILTADGGPIACPVTYTCVGDLWASPGWMVGLALAENRIRTQSGFQDRNAAHLAGFQFSLVQRPLPLKPNEPHGLFGDTLRVVLDVSKTVERTEIDSLLFGFSPDDVLAVTLQCMRANASLESPRFRFLDVHITGWEALARFGGVFEVQAPPGARK